MKSKVLPVFFSLICMLWLMNLEFGPWPHITLSQVHANNLKEWLGRDLVERSLNKRIVVTPRGSWTEHRPTGTGIDRHVISSCPDLPLRQPGERYQDYQQRLRSTMLLWPRVCR
ncbi:MAG: hypothetical protein WD425_04050 [Nitrospirales bacterium]